MKKYKIYGNENTNLKLSDKAFDVYSDTSPLEIREYEKNGKFTYELNGAIEGVYSAEEVNEILEEMSDENEEII